MGQQQLLLIILGVIIVGIAIAVGLSLFAANSVQANKDALINDINNIAANAYQYYIRPVSMAGGGSSYTGYNIPQRMSCNDNGSFTASGNPLTIVGTSKTYPTGTVTATVSALGVVNFTTFTDPFL